MSSATMTRMFGGFAAPDLAAAKAQLQNHPKTERSKIFFIGAGDSVLQKHVSNRRFYTLPIWSRLLALRSGCRRMIIRIGLWQRRARFLEKLIKYRVQFLHFLRHLRAEVVLF